MSDMLLAKPKLPEGWIDCSVGEPHLVRENLIKTFQLEEELKHGHVKLNELIYPSPNGYEPLVRHLEEKHGAPVIITNGAKQALGAVFYALKKMGRDLVGMTVPYWCLIPPLMDMHGVQCYQLMENPPHYSDPDFWRRESRLYLGPNNPDGSIHSESELIEMSESLKASKVPFIHDAAYYTHIYLPKSHNLPQFGDVQIYSISKMLGLSGLRIGYVVCPNPEFYKLILSYMEAMTVGVSIASQTWLYELLEHMKARPDLTDKFETISSEQLTNNKKLCLEIDPEVLEISTSLPSKPGMFGWFKTGPKLDLAKSKINVIDGALFGGPGMIRMNLAFPTKIMKEIVTRLNSVT